MELDYGVQLDAGGMLTIPGNDAYSFGTGDFSVTALFQTTQPGTIVSRKAGNGGSSDCAGWLLVLEPDGVIKLSTDNGSDFYEADSEPTRALDGTWHSVAAVRKDGVVSIYLDGTALQVTPQGGAATPLNVSNDLRILIGNCDQEQEPYHQFIGGIEDVTLWNRALEPEEIRKTMFDQVRHDTPGLVGMWEMNNNFVDSSLIANDASPVGSVSFVRVCYCVWTEAANNYSYCAIDLKPDEAEKALSPNDADVAHRMQSMPITPGTPFLYGAVIDQSKPDGAFPEGAIVRVFQPDGTELNQEVYTDTLIVHLSGHSVQCFVVKDPQPGQWIFSVECPSCIPILVSVQTAPTANIPQTIDGALVELYGKVPAGYARALAKRGPNALAEFSDFWCDVAFWAGVAVAAVAVAAVAVALVVVAPPTLAIYCMAAIGVAYLSVMVELADDITNAARRAAEDIGLGQPDFGGTAYGSAYLVHDGRAYFTLMRNLLLAVQAGNYDLDGMQMPSRPTFEGLIRGISDAGRNAYVLMWDTTDVYQVAEGRSVLRCLLQMLHIKPDDRPNNLTRQALSGLPNVQARLDEYPGFIKSQHEKMAVFSIDNVKCALVGGFNVITPPYWDDPDHPMLATDEQGRKNYHTWHDTAVFLQGPVVDLVEAEFDRRWSGTTPDASTIDCGTYAKIAGWQINHDSCLDLGVPPDDSPTPYRNPFRDLPQHPIDVMMTNSQYREPVRQISAKLIEKIGTATDYIYFENYAFHDVDLVRAVIERLRDADGDFRVVIMTPHPTADNDHVDQLGQFYLSRIAFAAMILDGDEWTEADFAENNVVSRADCRNWSVSIPDGSPIEHSVFNCVKRDGTPCSYALAKIVRVDQTPDCRLILASPARYFDNLDPSEQKYWLPGLSPNLRSVYIHSKLALFDDTYAVIGSANFTLRSMRNDGECSVGIDDRAAVQAIREELFAQWNVDSIRNWANCMNSFVESPSERLGVVPLSLQTLAEAPPPFKWWDWIVSAVDPSEFL